MRGTLPKVTAAPAPPATWAPRLWPIKWIKLNGVPVFLTRKSINCLLQQFLQSELFYEVIGRIGFLIYWPCVDRCSGYVAFNNQRIFNTRSQYGPINCYDIAWLSSQVSFFEINLIKLNLFNDQIIWKLFTISCGIGRPWISVPAMGKDLCRQ
jgi:hypothetical protein